MATTKCPVGAMVKLIRYPDSDSFEEFIGKVVDIVNDVNDLFYGYAIWESECEDKSPLLHTANNWAGDMSFKYYYISDEMFEKVKWGATCKPLETFSVNIDELI